MANVGTSQHQGILSPYPGVQGSYVTVRVVASSIGKFQGQDSTGVGHANEDCIMGRFSFGMVWIVA